MHEQRTPVDVPDCMGGRQLRREPFPMGAYCPSEVCEMPTVDVAFPEEDV